MDTEAQVPAEIAAAISGYEWNLVTASESGARIYLLNKAENPSLYLKCVGKSAAAELEAEAQLLTWLDGKLPVPKLLDFVRTGSGRFLLTSAHEGVSARTCMEQGLDVAELIPLLATALLRIHSVPIVGCPLQQALATRMRAARTRLEAGLIDKDDLDPERVNWSEERLWTELVRTRPLDEESVFTHGDYTLDNVLVSNSRVSGLVDLGRAGTGDPYRDLALMTRDIGPEWERCFCDAYGVRAIDRQKVDFYRLLDEFF